MRAIGGGLFCSNNIEQNNFIPYRDANEAGHGIRTFFFSGDCFA